MKLYILAFIALGFLGCKDEATTQAPTFAKSTSPFQIEVEVMHEVRGANHHYIFKAIAKAMNNIEQVEAKWTVPEGSFVQVESLPRFENDHWTSVLEMSSDRKNPDIVVEFTGSSQGTPLGYSMKIDYEDIEIRDKNGKSITTKKKRTSQFPSHTHF